ncbi:TPA: mucoidy inhibitor MuiA family protein [Serratia fonticola]
MIFFPRFNTTLVAASVLLACSGLAQAQNVTLNDVTVFIRGAELFNSSKVTLPAGESEIVFTNIASGLNEQSLMLDADNGVVVQSFSIKRDFLSENLSPEVEQLTKQIDDETREQSKLNVQREVIQAQLAVLESNRALGSEKEGASVEQVNQMLELVSRRMSEVLLADIAIKEKIAAIDKNIEKLKSQLAEAQEKTGQAVNQVVVKFYTPKAVSSNVKLSYVIPDAGWVPTYDVRVNSITQPVKLSYKANVFQNSGINWDKVNLTLSSGNPSEGAQAPQLHPWYLDFYQDYSSSKMAMSMSKPAPAPAPVAEMAYGAVADEAVAPRERKSLSDYVVTDAGGVNTRFSISLPYNIASDGKGHSVTIKDVEVQGDYRYVVVPKIEPDAFLQVQLKDWEKLNLLPGKSSIFFEGSFVGQGYINITEAKETLDLSLGRDKKIIVNRENEKQLTSKAELFGNSVSQQYSFATSVKNTRKEPIKLVVMDQLPLSRDSAITIDGLKYDGASYDKDTGNVQWAVDLPANQTQKFTLSYTVKYPKDKRVANL